MLSLNVAATGILVAILIGVCVIDMRDHRIPNALNLALLVSGLALPVLLRRHEPIWGFASVAAGFAVLFAVRWVYARLRHHQGLGLGDVKFFAAAGGWIGIEGLPSVLLVATLSALSLAAVLVLIGRLPVANRRLPFGPFLSIGLLTVWLVGPLQF